MSSGMALAATEVWAQESGEWCRRGSALSILFVLKQCEVHYSTLHV